MRYTTLGSTGMSVSRLCLGCMSYGVPDRGTHEWTLPEDESRPFIQRALEMGINFFDTADVYSNGVSEEVLGRALRELDDRARRARGHSRAHVVARDPDLTAPPSALRPARDR